MKKPMYRLALLATVASTFLISTPLFASVADDRIESSAKDTFVFRTYLKDDNIKMQSNDGIVTLTGTVSDESHISLAGTTVANVSGVTGVDNKLTEKGQAPAERSDAWLITKVKTTLLFHKNVNGSTTEVTGQNGTITLRGQASSAAQKDLTTEYAQDVEGVKNVINEMTVANGAGKIKSNTMSGKMDAMGNAIDDASITAMVKTTLLYHRSTGGLKTTVHTKDGVVTLTGKAKNSSEKDLAGKFASDVHGVKKVINQMTI